jgi:hypothetical protein
MFTSEGYMVINLLEEMKSMLQPQNATTEPFSPKEVGAIQNARTICNWYKVCIPTLNIYSFRYIYSYERKLFFCCIH